LPRLSNTPPTLLPTPFDALAAVADALLAAPYSTIVCADAGPWQANNPSTHPENRQKLRMVFTFRR